ncbi:MAG: DUF302 domain-containing protein [Ginsengibacter sp.]
MEELITIPGNLPFKETVERIISLIKGKGFTIFSCIDHAAEARSQGLDLRPTELIIFGNPNIGTLLMQDQQTCGIDLPVKILVWEDATGNVWLSYNTMSSLKAKHQLTEESHAVLRKIEEVVAGICAKSIEN